MNLINVMAVFDEINSTSSKNEKEAIIKRNADVPGFKEVLQFVYSPFVLTGLAKKKIQKSVHASHIQLNDVSEAMEYVKNNNTGSDRVVGAIQMFLHKLDNETRQFVENILIKDLKVGITSSTINKALGKNFIPKYDVMLASKWEDHCQKIKGEFQVSLKLDGIRCTVFNEETGPKFFTRQGHPIEGLIELEETFKHYPIGYVYDGEIIAKNPDNLPSDELFRYTQTIVRKDGIKTGLQLWLFDKLPIDEFHAGKSKLTLKDRMFSLETDILNSQKFDVELVPVYYIGDNQEKVYEILDQVVKKGKEGLMVSPTSSFYETKRSRTLLKVKQFHTVDLVITGFEEHKHGDKLGSLVVDYKGYVVNVGSGFNDVERESLWLKRQELIGTIVEVGYFEESNNAQGGISLRFPTFKMLRPEKDEPSYD